MKVFFVFFRYMVDAADHEKLEASRNELHGLLDKPQLAGIPVCICSNNYWHVVVMFEALMMVGIHRAVVHFLLCMFEVRVILPQNSSL